MNKNMIIWGILPIIIIIVFKYGGKIIDYILWDEYNDEYEGYEETGFDYEIIKLAYNEAKNCGYIGTLKDYIKMVGVKKDDDP